LKSAWADVTIIIVSKAAKQRANLIICEYFMTNMYVKGEERAPLDHANS
jgi:hypothetical protein